MELKIYESPAALVIKFKAGTLMENLYSKVGDGGKYTRRKQPTKADKKANPIWGEKNDSLWGEMPNSLWDE